MRYIALSIPRIDECRCQDALLGAFHFDTAFDGVILSCYDIVFYGAMLSCYDIVFHDAMLSCYDIVLQCNAFI